MSTSEIIKIPNARFSFPQIFKAKAFREGQDPRFEGSALLDPSDKEHAKVIKTILAEAEAVVKDKFGGKVPKKLKFGFGYANGDDFKVGGVTFHSDVKEYDGYEDMFYLSASNKTRPTVVDRQRNPLTEEDGRPYAGCYVNMSVTLWAQDNEFGQRVNANLRAVQFVKDGEAFGVKPVDAEEEFDEIEDIDDDSEEEGWDD